jgi:transmembrane sensor
MGIDKIHINKVFNQKFSLLNQKKLETYFEDRHLNEQTRDVLEEQWSHFEPDQENFPNLDHVFYKLYYTINNQKDSISKGRSLILRASQIAAILIVGLLIATSIYFSNSNDRKVSDQSIEFISQTGFRNQFKLPDGTTGWLGYGSQLKYHVDSNDKRVVDLNGLAFFNVAHRQKQPFIVTTPTKLNIEVLGTRFNVSSYSGDQTCEIVLEQGSVRLNLHDRKVGEMNPNERIEYNITNNTIEKSKVNVSDFVAWKDGKLILRDIPLRDACIKLSKFYNVDFEFKAKGFENQDVRLILENESLDEALKLLTMIVPVKFDIEDRKVLDDFSYSKKKIIIKNK